MWDFWGSENCCKPIYRSIYLSVLSIYLSTMDVSTMDLYLPTKCIYDGCIYLRSLSTINLSIYDGFMYLRCLRTIESIYLWTISIYDVYLQYLSIYDGFIYLRWIYLSTKSSNDGFVYLRSLSTIDWSIYDIYLKIPISLSMTSIFDISLSTMSIHNWTYRVAKTRRIPYLYRSFSAKETYI